jgi:hypothetical protein
MPSWRVQQSAIDLFARSRSAGAEILVKEFQLGYRLSESFTPSLATYSVFNGSVRGSEVRTATDLQSDTPIALV